MKLSPLDIYNKEFKKSAIGYNTQEVEDFLEDVGMAYEKLLKEINNLKDKNDSLKNELENYEKIDQKLQNTLEAVQKTVEDEKERAKKEAELIKKEARDEAKKIKENARDEISDQYKKIEELKEKKKLFEIRFKTLLQSHLELLNDKDEDEVDIDLENFEKDIAVANGDNS